MENFKIGDVVYFDETHGGIIQSINEVEQSVVLKWIHLEDEWFKSLQFKTFSKNFNEIRFTF